MKEPLQHFRTYLNSPQGYRALFLWIGGIYAVIKYGSYLYFKYPSAPGGDLYNHFVTLTLLKQAGIRGFFGGYPKLFHLFVIVGMWITHLSFLKFLLILTPIVTLAAAYSWSRIAEIIAGKSAGLLTFFVFLFICAQPHQTLGDGGFPNFIAAGILLPYFFIALAHLVEDASKKAWRSVIIWFVVIILTHHITTFYALVGVFAFLIGRYRLKSIKPLGIAFGLLLLFIVTPLGEGIRGLLEVVVKFHAGFPWIGLSNTTDSAAVWALKDYGIGISYFVVYIGLVGLIPFALIAYKQRNSKGMLATMIVMLGILLLLGSQMRGLEFPVRLARDAALPLMVTACCSVVFLLRRYAHSLVMVILIVAGAIWLMIPHFVDGMNRNFRYNDWMEYSAATDAAVKYVEGEPAGTVGLSVPLVVRPSLRAVALSPANPDGSSDAYNLSQLEGLTYVFFEVRPHAGDPATAALERVGFRQITSFTDPIKIVYVFFRNN